MATQQSFPTLPRTRCRTAGVDVTESTLRVVGIALIVLLALPPRLAFADGAEDRARAIELFRSSQGAYDEGRFAEAADMLEEAYRLDPNPILLYNLARARESAGQLDLAAEAWRRYLRESPDADDRSAVEARLAAIEAQLEEKARLQRMLEAERETAKRAEEEKQAAARREAEARALAASRPASGPGALPWVVTGLGVAGVGAGAVLGVLASGKHDDANDAASQQGAADLADEADGLAAGANIAFAAGGAVAVAGLLWWLLDDGEAAPPVGVGVGPGGAAVTARF